MNRRIQQALDGELPLERLSAAERAELAAFEQTMAQVLEQVPDAGNLPDVSGAVLWRIAHSPPREPARGPLATVLRPLAWLWQPRQVRVRPAWAVAVLVVFAGGGLLLERQPAPAPLVAGQERAANQLVQFRLGARGVHDVALVGDFGGWRVRYPLEQVAPGVWATALPLAPGVYDYAFVVDGTTWMLDPLAPAVADGFGGANSRLSVLAPERRART